MAMNTSAEAALRSIAILPVIVSSITPIAETSDVSLMRVISWLPSGPKIRSSACGRITWRNALSRPVLNGNPQDPTSEFRRVEPEQREPEIDEIDLEQQRRVPHHLDESSNGRHEDCAVLESRQQQQQSEHEC